jgi:hypothetical protein
LSHFGSFCLVSLQNGYQKLPNFPVLKTIFDSLSAVPPPLPSTPSREKIHHGRCFFSSIPEIMATKSYQILMDTLIEARRAIGASIPSSSKKGNAPQ